jgi:hypothetical protein
LAKFSRELAKFVKREKRRFVVAIDAVKSGTMSAIRRARVHSRHPSAVSPG